MNSTGGNGHYAVEPRGYAKAIISPADNGAIAFECQTIIVTSGQRHHIAYSRGYFSMTTFVQSPAHDCSVAPECQAVIATSGQCDHVVKSSRQSSLTMIVQSPRGDVGCRLDNLERAGTGSGSRLGGHSHHPAGGACRYARH